MKKGKIYSISLGPGDPELLTIKGLKILKKVDKIYYPGSLLSNGKTTSFSLEILRYFDLNENKLIGMFLDMSDDRNQAEATYDTTFKSLLTDYNNGLEVAFVSEGDSLFYSTFAYLLEHIQKHQLDVEIISGVPSFILGASQQQIPLAILNEKIAIIPRVKNSSELEETLTNFDTVVLIKIRSTLKEIIPAIELNNFKIQYCERLGTPQQFISTNINEIKHREIPYFSLLIIKR